MEVLPIEFIYKERCLQILKGISTEDVLGIFAVAQTWSKTFPINVLRLH